MKIFLKYIFFTLLCFFLACEDDNIDLSQVPSSIVITPLNLILKPNQTVQLYALVMDTKNKELDEANVIWSSGNDSVAIVNDKGVVTARSKGSATIRASFEDIEGVAEISVATSRRRILSEMFTSST
tara:strand:- start:139 stop:519 length:381 start_codon:yes stop_codon:yes gene_type:complete